MLNQRGQSLLVVLIAAAIGSIVAVALADLMVNFGSLTRFMRSEDDTVLLVREIEARLGQTTECEKSFVHANPSDICNGVSSDIQIVVKTVGPPPLFEVNVESILDSTGGFRNLKNVEYVLVNCDPRSIGTGDTQRATLRITADRPMQVDPVSGNLLTGTYGGKIELPYEMEFSFERVAGIPTIQSCFAKVSEFSEKALCSSLRGRRWDEKSKTCIMKREFCEVTCEQADIASPPVTPTDPIIDIPDGVLDATDLIAVRKAMFSDPYTHGFADLDCDGVVSYLDFYNVLNCITGVDPHGYNLRDHCSAISENRNLRIADCDLDPGIFTNPRGARLITPSDFEFLSATDDTIEAFPSLNVFGRRTVVQDTLKADTDCDGRITARDFERINYCRNKYGSLSQHSPDFRIREVGRLISRTGNPLRLRDLGDSSPDPRVMEFPVASNWPWGEYCIVQYSNDPFGTYLNPDASPYPIGPDLINPDLINQSDRANNGNPSKCPAGFDERVFEFNRNLVTGILTGFGIQLIPPFIDPHIHIQNPPYVCASPSKDSNMTGWDCLVGPFGGLIGSHFRFCCLGEGNERRVLNRRN